jgi:beta-N-acetylhexosaminidase
LFERDLLPYRTLLNDSQQPAVMVAHAAYPNVYLQEKDQNGKLLPSSLSFNFVTDLLRKEMNFDGVAITDDLEMGAILKNYGIGEACVMAVEAGEDMLAICAGVESIYEGFSAVENSVGSGRISESRIDESIVRIGKIKSRITEPLQYDQHQLDELSAEIADFSAHLN